MIDSRVLKGASVRDRKGNLGRVANVSLPWVRLAWGGLKEQEQVFLRSDSRLQTDIEVHTLNGWKPIGQVIGAKSMRQIEPNEERLEAFRDLAGESLDEATVDSLIEQLHALHEASKHYPFKRKAKLGPGPRKRINKKSRRFNCKCSKYKCLCKVKGKKKPKTVVIDRGYKKAYNAEYRAWLKKKGKKKAGKKAGEKRGKKKVVKKKAKKK